MGNRTSITTLAGVTNYEYDALNRLTKVIDNEGKITEYKYSRVGSRESAKYPNGTITEYEYDELNRLTKLINKKATGEVISSYEYELAPSGERIKVIEDTGRIVEYSYDNLIRLIEESITNEENETSTINYTYDKVGNRLTKTENGLLIHYTYDANDRLLAENNNTYKYDNNGNLISKISDKENISYSYNYQNRLFKSETKDDLGSSIVEYTYDIDGNRIKKVVDNIDTTNYLIDSNRRHSEVIYESDKAGAIKVSYIHGDDLISQNREGQKYYYHYDGLGSVRQLIDEVGTITDIYIYDAFGNLIDKTGSTENEYLYTGEQYDPNLGFYYLRARYMDPSIGRFISMDSFEGLNHDPSTLHKYLYTSNNPVNMVDPSGHFALGPIMIGLSIGSTLRGMQLSYCNMMVQNLIDSSFYADTLIAVGTKIQDLALNTIIKGNINNNIMELYTTGRNQELAGYKAISMSIRNNFGDFLIGNLLPVEVEVIIKSERKRVKVLSFDITDLTGLFEQEDEDYYDILKSFKDLPQDIEEYLKTILDKKSNREEIKNRQEIVLEAVDKILDNIFLD